MNSNALIGYSGLINNNYSTSITSTDIVCDSITAQHYYNIFCQTIGITIGNPEISLLYDDLTNTFTLHIYSNSIPLSRLKNDIYDSLAIPSTLVFRDATNSTTLSNLTITGGINLGVGLTYKINGVDLKTSDIPENINLYYTDTRARLSISGTAPIIYTNSTGVISLNTTIAQATTFTSTATFSNGSNARGAPYSAVFGLASSTKSGQIALIDALTYNSYAQLYCRSRNFGVQGNIDTISLEKATTIITSLDIKLSMAGASYCLIDNTGINIPTGETYKINGITLDTDDIQESIAPAAVNKYYTDTRARLSISGSAPIIYNNVSGVISLDTTINQATTFTSLLTTNSIKIKDLNYISVSDTTSGIDYFKVDYTGVNIESGLTYKIDGVDLKTSDIGEFTNLYYTNARARLATSLSSVGSEISASYDNSTGIITVPAITTNSILLSKLKTGSGNNIIVCNNATGVPTYVTMSGDITTTNGVCLVGADKITTIKILNANVIPAKISLGTVNQFLQTSSTLVNNWVSLSGDATLTDGVMTIGNDKITTVKVLNANITPAKISLGTVNQFLQTNLSLVNVWTTMTGDGGLANGILTITSGAISLLKIASSAYSQLASSVSTLVQRDTSGNINVDKITTPEITLNSSGINTLQAIDISKIVSSTYPTAGIIYCPYYNSKYQSLNGITASLTSVNPIWARVSATNILEVAMYSKGGSPAWRVEGQLCNYYLSPAAQAYINVIVFMNAPSTATVTSPTALHCLSTTFINRNVAGANVTTVTPFIGCLAVGSPSWPEGTCFTFTVYVSVFAGSVLCGRTGNDIQSSISVTQIN